jgi:hypothetical protein
VISIGAAACEPEIDETTDTSSTSSSSDGSGGTQSVASATTTAGVGGSGDTGIQCFAAYTDIPMGECDMLLQNCGAGMGCEAFQQGIGWTTTCVPDEGLKGPGDPCVNSNSCRAGSYCVFDRCSPVCCPITNEPCGVNGVCNVDSPFGPHTAQTCSYLATCTLFTGECGDEANCYPLLDDGNSVCAPITGATVGEGEVCGAINECDDSMVCNGGICSWACYLDGNGQSEGAGGCPSGLTCTEAGMNPPQNVGVCG